VAPLGKKVFFPERESGLRGGSLDTRTCDGDPHSGFRASYVNVPLFFWRSSSAGCTAESALVSTTVATLPPLPALALTVICSLLFAPFRSTLRKVVKHYRVIE
jgi:hypothetical protein